MRCFLILHKLPKKVYEINSHFFCRYHQSQRDYFMKFDFQQIFNKGKVQTLQVFFFFLSLRFEDQITIGFIMRKEITVFSLIQKAFDL